MRHFRAKMVLRQESLRVVLCKVVSIKLVVVQQRILILRWEMPDSHEQVIATICFVPRASMLESPPLCKPQEINRWVYPNDLSEKGIGSDLE